MRPLSVADSAAIASRLRNIGIMGASDISYDVFRKLRRFSIEISPIGLLSLNDRCRNFAAIQA